MARDNINDGKSEVLVAQVSGPNFTEILGEPNLPKDAVNSGKPVEKPVAKPEVAHKDVNLGESVPPPAAAEKGKEAGKEQGKDLGKVTDVEKIPEKAVAITGDEAQNLKAGLDTAKQVTNVILQEAKVANQAGDFEATKRAYEKAIAISQKVTDEQIALAKTELQQVTQAKSRETDTGKLKELAQREAELYTLTRIKDMAQGNMALWYYRNGRVEDGTQKFLEAAGLDSEKAAKLRKMDKDSQAEAVGQLNVNAPILADVNFMNAYERIRQSNQALPETFLQIHRHILEQQQGKKSVTEPVAQGDTTAKDGAVTVQEIQELAKQAQDPANEQIIKDYDSTMQTVASKGGKATADELAKLEAGVKVADLSYQVGKSQVDFLSQSLDKLIPKEKSATFEEGIGLINSSMKSMLAAGGTDAAGKPTVKPEDKQKVDILASGTSTPADKKAACEALGKAYPEFAQGFTKFQEAAGSQENGEKALSIFLLGSRLDRATEQAAFNKVRHHFETAEVFSVNGQDEKAKVILKAGLEGVPRDLSVNLVENNPDVAKLAQKLGLIQEAAESTSGQPLATVLKGKYPELADVTGKELMATINANHEKGPEALEETKKAYEELITRFSTPEYVEALKKDLSDNIKVLESGKGEDGQPLSDEDKIEYHRANLVVVESLKLVSATQLDYAEYLGSKDIRRATLPLADKPGNIQPAWKKDSLAQNQSMDFWAKEAIKTADSLPVDLMKKEQALLEADLAKGVKDPENIVTRGLDYLRGTKEHHGVMDSAVDMRVQLATLYIHQGVKLSADGEHLEPNKFSQKDELYKPDEAFKLMDEAIAKNKEIHGEGKDNNAINDLRSLMSVVEPEKMQKFAEGYKRDIQSSNANMGAAVVSVATQALGEIVLPIITKGKMKPGMVQATTAGLNLVDTSIARAALMRWQTGETESLADTMANSAAVSGTVLATRHVSRFAMDKLAQSKTMSIFNRAIDDLRLPATTSMDDVAQRLVQNNTIKDASVLSQFTGKTLGEVRGDSTELAKFVNAVPELHGSTGLNSLIANQGKVQQLDVANSLHVKGIKTVGDLEGRLNGNLVKLRRFVDDAQNAGIDLNKTSVEDAIVKLHESGAARYANMPVASQQTMFNELGLQVEKVAGKEGQGGAYGFYQSMRGTKEVKTMDDLSRYLSNATGKSELERLFPSLAKQQPELKLTDYAREGGVLANAQTSASSRALVERFAPGSMHEYNSVGFGTRFKEAIGADRFYAVPFQKGSIASMSNRSLASYANARNELATVAGTFTGVSIYENATTVYDDHIKGSATGDKLTLDEALLKANFGSANARFDSVSGIGSSLLHSNIVKSIMIGAPIKSFILGRPDTRLSAGVQINRYLSRSSMFGGALSIGNAYSLFPNGDAEGLYSQYDSLNQAAQKPLTNFNYDLGLAVPGKAEKPEPVSGNGEPKEGATEKNVEPIKDVEPVKVVIPPLPDKQPEKSQGQPDKGQEQPKPKLNEKAPNVGAIDDIG